MMFAPIPRRWTGALAIAVAAFVLTGAAFAATLDTVKERGRLLCGVNEGLHGFAEPDAAGKWTGFDVDFCRAVAAAIFGDAGKVEYVPLSSNDRFEALKSGKVDVLSRNSTWTMSRETDLGLTFVGVTYYDGQGFMVPRSRNLASALELGGSKVCVQTGTTTEANLADFFGANNMTFEAVTAGTSAEALAAYKDGRCNVLTSDMSQLYALRLGLPAPDDQLILPDAISKEPLGPAVREDDPKWATLVKWVLFALVNGEELGVGTDTVDAALTSKKPDVERLVGTDGTFGEEMGLSKSWAANALRLVGNYGEIYERNVGPNTPLKIARGLNNLWNKGGIQYAPPVR
jgi:general L-amino acid transport system substrate-binding protein